MIKLREKIKEKKEKSIKRSKKNKSRINVAYLRNLNIKQDPERVIKKKKQKEQNGDYYCEENTKPRIKLMEKAYYYYFNTKIIN